MTDIHFKIDYVVVYMECDKLGYKKELFQSLIGDLDLSRLRSSSWTSPVEFLLEPRS